MSRAVLIIGLFALCGGRATGQASDQSCDLPSALAQDDSERSPAIQFSLTDVRDSFGFLQNIAFADQQYSVNDCALSLYAVTVDLPNIPVIGNLPLAGDFMSCFNSTESGDVSQEEVARATIIRFGSQSVPRPAAVPAALYESEGLLVDIRYRQFPTELVQHMRCIYTISRFNLQVWTDVRTTLVGCPETYWDPDCRSECQCQDNGPCHPFTGRCYDDAGPTTPSRLDTTMTPTVIPDTTSAEIETSSPTPVTSTPGPRPPDQCDILPQQQLASAGSSPLRFNFSEIEESVGLWEDVQIDDYFYDVDNCTLILYTRSPGIPRLLVDVQLTEEMVACYDMGQGSVDMNTVRAQGTFLKYLDQAFPRPAIVPESWYQGNRVVMRIVYDRFPHSDAQSMRCLFNFVALPLNLDVWVDVDTTPMGCPATHWGMSCQSDCPCQNGGRCETFTGECVCPEGTSGESCENGISEVVPTPLPPSTEPPVELAGRDSFADCYPQFADPFINGDNNGEPEVSFTLSPVQDSLALFEEANVIVEDQLYGVVNCSLTLYLRTSVLPQVLSVPLAGERMTCFRLTNTLMITSDQVAEGTFLKFLRQALSRPALVPETWYAGLNAVFAITYNSFPVEPLMTMRCNYTVPGVGLNIFIDIVTTTNMVFRQSTRATAPPPVTTTTTTTPPPVTTTRTTTPPPVTTTTTTTPPPVTTTLPPSTTTPLPPTRGRAAVTTTPVAPPTTTTVPSIPPEIIVTTVRPDPVSGIPGTTPASVDIRPEYRCYIPPHEPLVAAVGQRPINISATPLQDTLGLLSGLQIADYVLDVFNCSLTLYILTTPLPNLPRNLDVVGQPASCLLMQGSAVIPSTELATGTIVKFFDQSLVRPSVVPPSWYESGGLVVRVDYNFFAGLYPKTMKCTFNVPSIGNSISTEIETTAIGCPRSHWGPRCENQCPCVNGGSCYTFAGGCHCEELTYGQFCEVMMPLAGPSAVSVRDLNRRNG